MLVAIQRVILFIFSQFLGSDSSDGGGSLSDLEVEAGALDGIGADFAVGNSHMLGMDGVTLQGFFALEGAVEHHVGIRRSQTAIDVHFDIKESGHFAYESFQTFLDTFLDSLFLLFGEFWIQRPDDDVLNHNRMIFKVKLILINV